MTRDTKRWAALLAGPIAVIVVAIAGAVYRPSIWEPNPHPHPVTFEERWRDRVTVPLGMSRRDGVLTPDGAGIPAWWRAEDGALMPVQGTRPGLPFPVPVKTERILQQ
jgi:hypothetical protein